MSASSLPLHCCAPARMRLPYLCLLGFSLVTVVPAAFAHDSRPHLLSDLWSAWNWGPWIVCGLTVARTPCHLHVPEDAP